MSKCPYRFALHPGVIYGGPLLHKPGWGDVQWIGHDALIKAYDLDPKDCISWAAKYTRISGPKFIRQYVHLHPVEDGRYAEALIKAILMHEKYKADHEAAKKLLGERNKMYDPILAWIDECATENKLAYKRVILKEGKK